MSNDSGKRSYSEHSEDGGKSGEVAADWLKGEILSAIGGSAHSPLFSSPLRLERRRREQIITSSNSCGSGNGDGGGGGDSLVDWEREVAASCTVYWVARFSDEVNERAAALTKVGDVRGDAAIIVHTAGAAAAAQAEELLNIFLRKRGPNRGAPRSASASSTQPAASAAAALNPGASNAVGAPPPRESRPFAAGASTSAAPTSASAVPVSDAVTASSKALTTQAGRQGVSESPAECPALLEPTAAVGLSAEVMMPDISRPPAGSAAAVADEATSVSDRSLRTDCSVAERAAATSAGLAAPAAAAAAGARDGLSVAQTLTPDALVRVFTFVGFTDLAACCRVCTLWRSAILDDELLLADARITRTLKTPISTSVRGVVPPHPLTTSTTVRETSSSSSSNTRDGNGVGGRQEQQHLPHQRLQHLHPSLRQKILAAMRAAKPIPAIIIRAAHAGNAAAMAWYAEALDEGGEHHCALEWYRKAARSGHQASQYVMGVAYYRGDGDWIRDEEEALSWLLRCVKNPEEDRQLCAAAALLLGYMYLDGEGTARVSIDDAIKWLKLARDLGSKEAEETVGSLWNTGQY